MTARPQRPMTSTGGRPRRLRHPILTVLFPLGCGYLLSYFFRGANSVIAGDLLRDVHADAATLGILTSVYFLAFTATQLPLGAALDRFGPGLVQSTLLLLAALGAAIFASAHDVATLAAGRFLIGIGTAGCLMAGLKATATWFAAERLIQVNGTFILFGGIGMLSATVPLDALSRAIGWRHVFVLAAAMSVILAGATRILVPHSTRAGSAVARGADSYATLLRRPALWILAPLSALTFGSASALQGLWATRWFTEVEGLDGTEVSHRLFAMALALTLGGPLIARLGRRLGARQLAIAFALLLIAGECLAILRAPVPDLILWPAIALAGAVPVISYSLLAQAVPERAIARANAILNIAHTAAAFALQALIGVTVSLWPVAAGRYPPEAYQGALSGTVALQVVALAWFVLPRASRIAFSAAPDRRPAPLPATRVADRTRDAPRPRVSG